MNIVKDLVARIEKRLTETKKPCKLYSSEATAEKVAEEEAKFLAVYFSKHGFSDDEAKNIRPARYVVVHIPSVNKWAIGLDQTEVMSRKDSVGGYAMIMADRGIYTF